MYNVSMGPFTLRAVRSTIGCNLTVKMNLFQVYRVVWNRKL